MKLRIDSVHGHGDHKEERVRLTALEDCNLHYYMISDATFAESGRLSNKHRHSKWFNSKEVKKGDRVVLYTRNGTDVTVKGDDGVVWHKVYWGLSSGVWNDDGDAAVLIRIGAWNSTAVK
ncbi:hypothetical protein CQ009_12780 [Pseudomonas sp. MYb2]|nr:hypothetical protein CQ025_09425 [Pseudomonas sp. MYb3]PRC34533.1 hypothetical protein CQ009_12780 [Pseudomonas sp. MYb2]